MAGIKIDTFGGMIPAVDDHLLPTKSAAHAENCWLYTGRLTGIPQPTLVRACTAGTTKVFRIPNNYADANYLTDSLWLEFENADTDVVRAVVRDDTFDRYYWASSSLAPRYNTRLRIAASSAGWLLGIPAPAQPGLGATGGVGASTTRSYLTTWVSAYGEEGPVSTPIVVTGKVDDTWALTFTAADTTDLGAPGDNRYLTHTRIYRTVTSAAGVATYFLVAEIAIGTLSHNDTASDTTVSSNNQLESTNWIAPPADLQGIIAMPNGILAGWRENEIWFSEPYRPHAWPAAYSVVVDYPVVGLGVTNQTLVICTKGFPMTASGVHPSTMALGKSAALEPCLSRGSILSSMEGVYYASPNGLIVAAAGAFTNLTRTLLHKDKWQEFARVSTFRAARVGTGYYAFGSTVPGVFQTDAFQTDAFQQTDFGDSYTGIFIDPAEQRIGFNLMSDPAPVSGVQNDPWSGEVFIIKGDNLYRIDLANTAPVPRVFIWRSKILQYPVPVNLGAIKVYWVAPTTAPDATATPPSLGRAVEFPELPVGSTYGVLRLYADDVLVLTHQLTTSGEIIRAPSGYKANFYQLEFESYLTIYSVQIARTVKELASV